MRIMASRILASILIIFSVSLAVVWEVYFDDRINTVPVFQAVNQMPKGHKISKADLILTRARLNLIPDGAITDLAKVLGRETVIPIKKGMIVVGDYFDDPDIVPDDNQMVTPIPNQWIYSLPGSLRRKDKVFIYGLPTVNSVISGSSVVTANQFPNGEPLLKDIAVAFAKDSANQEVKPSDDKSQRIDATGNISQLELILTPGQFKLLESKALSGYKFVFTYR